MKISLKQILKNVLSKFKFAGALCESLLWWLTQQCHLFIFAPIIRFHPAALIVRVHEVPRPVRVRSQGGWVRNGIRVDWLCGKYMTICLILVRCYKRGFNACVGKLKVKKSVTAWRKWRAINRCKSADVPNVVSNFLATVRLTSTGNPVLGNQKNCVAPIKTMVEQVEKIRSLTQGIVDDEDLRRYGMVQAWVAKKLVNITF